MTNKKLKKRKNQERQMRKSVKARKRRKSILATKKNRKTIRKVLNTKTTNTNNLKDLPLKARLRHFFITNYRKIKCKIGIHEWRLCSGMEGESKFACIDCWKRSKKKWGNGGSEGHYDKKYDNLGISEESNWEEKDGKWYFKEEEIDLKKEQVRKLKAILNRKKDEEKSKYLQRDKTS